MRLAGGGLSRSPADGEMRSSNTHVETDGEDFADPGAIPGTSITPSALRSDRNAEFLFLCAGVRHAGLRKQGVDRRAGVAAASAPIAEGDRACAGSAIGSAQR